MKILLFSAIAASFGMQRNSGQKRLNDMFFCEEIGRFIKMWDDNARSET